MPEPRRSLNLAPAVESCLRVSSIPLRWPQNIDGGEAPRLTFNASSDLWCPLLDARSGRALEGLSETRCKERGGIFALGKFRSIYWRRAGGQCGDLLDHVCAGQRRGRRGFRAARDCGQTKKAK